MADLTSGKSVVQLTVVCCLCSVMGGCAKRSRLDPTFTTGRQTLMRGEFKAAIKKLQQYLDQSPNGALASRASFLIAKAHLGLGEYDEARKQFQRTLDLYVESEEAHKSRYKLAMLCLIEGKRDEARGRFKELVDQPSGTLVPEATAMLRFLDDGE